MKTLEQIGGYSKAEQVAASKLYHALMPYLDNRKHEFSVLVDDHKIDVPQFSLELLSKVLKIVGSGNAASVVQHESLLTTQEAAAILGCSRPHLVKLLDSDIIKYTKVGKHRRVKLEDVLKFRKNKEKSKKILIEIMRGDEELGLYEE